jgi:hypothetical protein
VLRCQSPRADETLHVPAVRLDVEPLPEAGRPKDFGGLVGPLLLHLTVTPERVALGQSVRVALLARGTGNLWLLDAPFAASAFPGAQVFEKPPELALERGRALYVRQHLALDLVPRAAGRLTIPALRVPYFDPERHAYRVAETQEVAVMVEERLPASAPPSQATHAPARSEAARGSGGSSAAFAAGASAALGAGAAFWWRRRRRSDGATQQALEQALAARAAGDAQGELAALARALRAALAHRLPGAAALSVEELESRAATRPAREAVRLLAALERARFEPGAPAPAADAVARAVRALGGPSVGNARAVATALLCAAALGGGCASPAGRDAPMTPGKLEELLREETQELEVVQNQLRFLYGGVRMVCIHDVRADRVRLVAAVAPESDLTVANARILLQANFGQTLDARYAIREGMLYAVFLHPLSTLVPRQIESALEQVASLVRNYGTSFSVNVR